MEVRACRSVGIDLGTTYSSLAYLDDQMRARIVLDSSGKGAVPSVIFFDDEEIIVGEIALQNSRVRADRVVQFVKDHIGYPWVRVIGGREHRPEFLSAILLAHLVREAEPQVGPIPSAVITVPAYFTERRRRATRQAGEIAGLEVLDTLNEPMAAALAYGLHHEPKEQVVAIYDLGGGTFDVTIVRIAPGAIEELVTEGDPHLGGKDWDQCLMDHVLADFSRAHGTRIEPRGAPEDVQYLQNLQQLCEEAKKELGRRPRTTIVFNARGIEHRLEVTREQFEAMTAHLLGRTRLTTELALDDAGLRWDQVARVVLVGGSTQMPMVRQMIRQSSGRAPDTGINPVVAVAQGAAIYAHMLETGRAPRSIHPRPLPQRQPAAPPAGGEPAAADPPGAAFPQVRFVTAHGVGVKARTKQGRSINVVIIPKNQPVPAEKTRPFSAPAQARRIKVDVTQGDNPDLDLVEVLGTLVIQGLPADQPAGRPVDVTLSFDEQGRLHARALYRATGQSLELSLDVAGGLDDQQVAQLRRSLQDLGLIRGPEGDRAPAPHGPTDPDPRP
jgi:molecular chaperone DnaK